MPFCGEDRRRYSARRTDESIRAPLGGQAFLSSKNLRQILTQRGKEDGAVAAKMLHHVECRRSKDKRQRADGPESREAPARWRNNGLMLLWREEAKTRNIQRVDEMLKGEAAQFDCPHEDRGYRAECIGCQNIEGFETMIRMQQLCSRTLLIRYTEVLKRLIP
jgi:hypothetical protein